MSLSSMANTPCGRAAIDENDLRGLLNKLDQEGLAGDLEDELSQKAKFIDGVYEYYVNALLSHPSTIGVNAISNMVPVATRVLETLAAAGSSQIRSKLWGSAKERTTYMEAIAEAQGIGEGFKEAWTFLGLRMKSNINPSSGSESILASMGLPEQLAKQAKIERQHRAIKGKEGDDAWMSRALNFIGTLVNIPGGSLSRFDEMYKIINYRAEISKQAMRETIADMDNTGQSLSRQEIQHQFSTRKQAALEGQDEGIVAKGVADADRRTFTNRPEGGKSSINAAMADKGHTINCVRWLVPFRRTMINLMRYGIESTPASIIYTKTRQQLMAGGGAADEAMGRMAAGTAMISGLYYTLGDSLDGEPPANLQARDLWEKDGHEPDTVLIAGKRFDLDWFGPIAPALKVAARVQTILSNIDEENDDNGTSLMDSTAAQVSFVFADVMMDEHWLSSMGQFFNAIQSSGREGGWRPVMVYLNKFGTGFVPNVTKVGTRAIDPNVKDITNSLDAFLAKLPAISAMVPNKISIWGEDMRYDHFLDPEFEEATLGGDPVSVEMRKVGMEIPKKNRSTKIGQSTVRMTPDEFEQYQRWAGQGVRGARPLRDVLKSRMESRGYQRLPSDYAKSEYLRDAIIEYNSRAKQELLHSKDFTFGQRVYAAEKKLAQSLRR